MRMKRILIGIAVLPDSLSAAALDRDGRFLGAVEGARTGDARADVEALLSALGKKVPSIARGKFRAAIGWGGPSVLAVVGTGGAVGKAGEAAVRSALEADAGRSLDGWRIAYAPESGRKSGEIVAGGVPEGDVLSLNAAVEAAGGEVVGADLMPLVLLESLAELERGGEPSIAVVLLPGSLSLFLRGGGGSVTACRHRTLDGGDTGEQGETEVMRGLVAWEGKNGSAPKRLDLIDAAPLCGAGFADRLAEKVAVPVREVAVEEIVRRAMRGMQGQDVPPGVSCLAVLAAKRAR
jgi:hypothetical protein